LAHADASPLSAATYVETTVVIDARRHSPQLNFGDCLSNALPRDEILPLLTTGDDFRQLDVDAAAMLVLIA
jgi:uncharacterized protein with PIN domain